MMGDCPDASEHLLQEQFKASFISNGECEQGTVKRNRNAHRRYKIEEVDDISAGSSQDSDDDNQIINSDRPRVIDPRSLLVFGGFDIEEFDIISENLSDTSLNDNQNLTIKEDKISIAEGFYKNIRKRTSVRFSEEHCADGRLLNRKQGGCTHMEFVWPQQHPPPKSKCFVFFTQIVRWGVLFVDLLSLMNLIPTDGSVLIRNIPWDVPPPKPPRRLSFQVIEPNWQ